MTRAKSMLLQLVLGAVSSFGVTVLPLFHVLLLRASFAGAATTGLATT